jgi:hypothetical protein
VGFRRGSDRSNRRRAVLLPLGVSRHPESEIEISVELLLFELRSQAPSPKVQLKAIVQFATSKPHSLWEVRKEDPQISGFFMLIAQSLFLQIVDVPFRNPMKNQSAPHVMTAQIPGPASEWVISATQPFLLDPDRSSASFHYPSTKRRIPWFLFAFNSNWSDRQR